MSSWFRIYREIFDSDIWIDVTTFRLFMLLIGRATHQDDIKIAGVNLKRGEYLRSYRMLAKDLAYKEGRGRKEYSLRTIKRSIDKLISAERVNVRETEQGTVFTIVNYAEYQGFSDAEKESANTSNGEVNTNGKRTGNNNKNAKKARRNKNVKDYTSKIKDLLPVFSSIQNFNALSKQYWDVIRETRKTGNVSESVIYNNMDKWIKYDSEVIEYALKTHIENHSGKKEEYTIGIMRNTSKEEAIERMNINTQVIPLKAIAGGKSNEVRQSSYRQDYSKYDFSKKNDL